MRPASWFRVTVGVAAWAVTVTVAACTVGGSPDQAGGGGGRERTLTIVEWTNPPAIEATKRINEQFEKRHPGVKVDLRHAPTANDAWGKLKNGLIASKSVDITAEFPPGPSGFPPSYTGLKPGGVAAMITAGQMLDLKNQPFMKHYDPNLQKYAAGYRDGIYGVMAAQYVGTASGMWYKKDLLSKYNVPLPTTFDDFVKALETFQSHGMTPVFVAAKDGLQGGIFNGITQQLIMRGHEPNEATAIGVERAKAFWEGKLTWNDKVYQEAARRYVQVMKYVEPTAAGVSQQTAPGTWAANEDDYPFLVDGSWDGLTIKEANPNLNSGFFAFPGTDDPAANRIPIQPDLTWMVPTWAPNRDLALEWLELFSEPANYRMWLETTGSMSTQPGNEVASLPWMDWLNEHVPDGFPQVVNPWVPAGAASEASGPDLTKMTPIGPDSTEKTLAASVAAYRKAAAKK